MDSTTTSEGPTHLAATVTTATTTSNTLTSATATDSATDIILPKTTTLATAVAVDDRTIVVADPVETESTDQKRQKRKQHNVIVAVVGLLVLLTVIVLSVLLTQKGGKNAKDETGIPSTSTADDSTELPQNGNSLNDSESTQPLDYQQRTEDMIGILEFLYQDSEGGVDVFDASSPFASEDRIAALEWLVRDDPSQIAIPSADEENVNYEQQLYKVRQRYVLALLYMATNGQEWDKQYNFLAGIDECQWTSIYTQELANDDKSYIEDEFNVKGAICNDKGQLERLAMWWNGMSGTLPHELSLFSETLKELNLAGGSISGPIPNSITKLKNLEGLSMSDNCLTGDLPKEMNRIDMPNLAVFGVHMNNYGVTDYSGTMGSFCDGNGGILDGVVALAIDCPPEEFVVEGGDDNASNNLTLADVSPWGCDCCICCYPDEFKCQNLVTGDDWTSHFLDELSSNGFPKGFDTQCVSSEQEGWIAENCPCLINVTMEPTVQPFRGSCTTDCSQDGAIPSYDFGS